MATDCQGTLDELERFLDQELPDPLRNEVMDHLRQCTDCQQAFDFHGELKRVVREKALRDELPPQLMDKILGCFGEEWLAE
jgi:mycothiol system anti-sigma-R factor